MIQDLSGQKIFKFLRKKFAVAFSKLQARRYAITKTKSLKRVRYAKIKNKLKKINRKRRRYNPRMRWKRFWFKRRSRRRLHKRNVLVDHDFLYLI